jgi:triosephosphate isomerase
MLRELFVKYVIVGHSERRQIFEETDSLINKKVLAAHANELKPILCVGETLEEREAGSEKQVLETQLRGGLAGVSPAQLLETVIAYEPVWAIGTGKTATSAQADAHNHVRSVLEALDDATTAGPVRRQRQTGQRQGAARPA